MLYRTIFLYTALVIAAGIAPAFAGTRPMESAPTGARVEIAPLLRAGYIWPPGHQIGSGRQQIWVGGDYSRIRCGLLVRSYVRHRTVNCARTGYI